MKVDHLILFTQDVEKSGDFFCELFGFEKTDDDPGEENGLVIHSPETDVVILQFPEEKLPNPFHFAFAADEARFAELFKKANTMGLKPRKMPSKNSEAGFGEYLKRGGAVVKNFYINDPSGTILEVVNRPV